MKVNDEFILDIKRLGINGEGIGFYNKLAVFVENAIPGEGHNVRVTKVLNKMAFAESLEIKHQIKERQEPVCKYFNDCGGCNTMHIQYEKMCELKRDMLIESLNRYAPKLNTRSFEIKDTIKSPLTLGYRNRSLMPLRGTDYKNVKTCMIKEGTNHLVDIDECLIHNEIINELNQEIIAIASKLKVSVSSSNKKDGILRFLSIRVNENNEALVTFIVTDEDKLLDELLLKTSKLENVKGVYILLNNDYNQGNPLQGKLVHKYGEEFLILTLNNIKYKLYPTTFFQLNLNQASAINEIVLKKLKLSRNEKVLDIYCGVGFISLYIAHMAKEVIGIEYEKASIKAAEDNAVLNKIKNTRFYCGDAAKVLESLVEKESFDSVVLDPPRTGLDDNMIKALMNNDFKRIIYVSCNPATLAKNLDILSKKYNVNSIDVIDMFPETTNIESITTLSLKK